MTKAIAIIGLFILTACGEGGPLEQKKSHKYDINVDNKTNFTLTLSNLDGSYDSYCDKKPARKVGSVDRQTVGIIEALFEGCVNGGGSHGTIRYELKESPESDKPVADGYLKIDEGRSDILCQDSTCKLAEAKSN